MRFDHEQVKHHRDADEHLAPHFSEAASLAEKAKQPHSQVSVISL